MNQLNKQELLNLQPGDFIRKEYVTAPSSNYVSYQELKIISNKNNQLRLEFKYQNRLVRTKITINNTFKEDGTQVLHPSKTRVEYKFYKIGPLNF